MFASGFEFRLPAAAARFRQDELRSADLMLLRARQEGGIVDEAVQRPRGTRSTEWNRIRVVLDGPLQVRLGAGIEVGRGEMYGTANLCTETGRAITRSSDWLDLYWRSGSAIGSRLSSGAVVRLAPTAFQRVRTLADALEARSLPPVLEVGRDVLDALRAHGFPLEPDALEESAQHVDVSSPQFARLLWQLAGQLSRQPMAVDLSRALDLSERHALRLASQHFQRFHVSASSWREFLNCLRLEMGAFFMSAPAARTEEVSRFLGFSSPTGFCHALQDAGLPSPVRLQAELRCA